MQFRKCFLWLTLAVALPTPAFALDPAYGLSQYVHGYWDTSRGLPHPKVQAIVQDGDGYLWIGTEGGLVRFDGARFTAFAPPEAPEYRTESVRALLLGRDGSIWIGRDDGVVGQFKGGHLQEYRARTNQQTYMIRGLVEDRNGIVWAGALHGLYRVADGTLTRIAVDTGIIYSLFLDADGQVWAPTSGQGVFVFRDGVQVGRVTRQNGLPSDVIYSVCQRADRTIWVGTARGVAAREGERWVLHGTEEGLPDRSVRVLLTDGQDQVWAGTWSGLARWETNRFSALRAGEELIDDSINALFEDRDGVLWVGTRGAGLNMFRDSSAHTHTRRQGLPADKIETIFADRRGRIWMSFNEGSPGNYQDGVWATVDLVGALRGSFVTGITEDREGTVWLATNRGLGRFEDGHVSPVSLQPAVRIESVMGARQGGLWLIADGRLYTYGREGLVAPGTRRGVG